MANFGDDYADEFDDKPDGECDGEFEDSEGAVWRETKSGSYARYDPGEPPDAVVFFKTGVRQGWFGVSNAFDRFTRDRSDDPKSAAELLLEAEREGEHSALWTPPNTTDWGPSAPKGGRPGYWRKQEGVILAVRQCPPDPHGRYAPSWIAFIGAGEPVLAANGKPWFPSAEGAMMAAEAEHERQESLRSQLQGR